MVEARLAGTWLMKIEPMTVMGSGSPVLDPGRCWARRPHHRACVGWVGVTGRGGDPGAWPLGAREVTDQHLPYDHGCCLTAASR